MNSSALRGFRGGATRRGGGVGPGDSLAAKRTFRNGHASVRSRLSRGRKQGDSSPSLFLDERTALGAYRRKKKMALRAVLLRQSLVFCHSFLV